MKMRGFTAIATLAGTLAVSPAQAVIFDFSYDEFSGFGTNGIVTNSASTRSSLDVMQLTDPVSGVTLTFGLSAINFGGNPEGNPEVNDPTFDSPLGWKASVPGIVNNPPVGLYVPSQDNGDPDLEFGTTPNPIDDDPIVATQFDINPGGGVTNITLDGVEDTNPLLPGTNGIPMAIDHSLVVNGSGSTSVVNDLAANTLITFELLTPGAHVQLTKMTFVDDVDVLVSVGGNPSGSTSSFSDLFGMPAGDIKIDGESGPGNCTVGSTAGDSCVAGLSFNDSEIFTGESITVLFDGSGGVLGMEFVVLPVPGAAPMLATGLLLLGYAGYRRRRSS